ncbi:MAG: NAD(P)-binding domain-containing protein [Flavobacteriaceae bacterium]
MFDVLIIGGGASGMSCALIIGSALEKSFAKDKKAGIIMHQKASHMQSALFNNVLGIQPGTHGDTVLKSGQEQLTNLYPLLQQIENEKVTEISRQEGFFVVTTNKTVYHAKTIVVATGYAQPFTIKGLEQYLTPHQMAKPEKNRIQLKNNLHVVAKNLYVAGSLAGWRSQFAIACGSGAQVATDILTLWNDGNHTKVHDKKL